MNIPETLNKSFLFGSFSSDQLRQLAEFTTVKKLKKDERLFDEGEKASAFYFVASGSVKIYRISSEGQEHTIEIQRDGDLVAEAAIFDKETYPAFCQAMDETVLLRIPKHDFIQMIERHPRIAIEIMHGYSKRLRWFVRLVEDLTMHNIKSRLARYILNNLSRDSERHISKLSISKKELASLLGTIPETLSRTLKSLKKDGLIGEEGDYIVIQNLRRLREVAE